MISENINRAWKIALARTGDARVFGEQSDVRRKMDDNAALDHFAAIWRRELEPGVRNAPKITIEEAKELLEGKQRDFVLPSFEYRQFSLYHVVFVARVTQADPRQCDQLWPLGTHRDNTRLCMFFDTIAEKERFDNIAKQLNWEPKELALKLATDFLAKFPVR